MNLPRYSLDNAKVVYFFLALLLVGGLISFGQLGKKEDSPFVIKSASIVTRYPGATPEEVEKLVTEPIGREIQSMRRVYKITSESYYGLSKIMIELDPATPADEMPQMWDELRRKVLNIQPQMPQDASPISVSDDFGDVFGIYYGLSAGEGFPYEERRGWAQRIKTALVTVKGVQKVTLFGEQSGVVNVYVSLSTLNNLFITPSEVIQTLQAQNTLVSSGEKLAGEMQIKLIETGTYKNLDDIRDQILTSSQGRQIRLGDIARVEQGYAEPPSTLMLLNGRPAIGIGISTDASKDVVKTGKLIEERLGTLMPLIPIGIDLVTLYPENRIAQEANNAFVINLLESVAIVIALIMLIMGLRSGMLIGSSLIFSIGGTLLIMQFLGVGLNRTSLAGFIIAMGMLVDNAIVVTDNARNGMLRGVPPMGPARGYLHRRLLVPAALPGAVGGGRDCQTVVRRAGHFADVELGIGADTDAAVRRIYPQTGHGGRTARSVCRQVLPPVRPTVGTADRPPLSNGRNCGGPLRRIVAGDGGSPAELLPEPR